MSHNSQFDDANIRDKEIKKLVTFVKDLRLDLEDFIYDYDILVPHYPEFKESFITAWNEVTPKFQFIIDYLMKLDSLEKLSMNGLTGKQLDLKLQLITVAREEVEITRHMYFVVLFESEADLKELKNEQISEIIQKESMRKRIWDRVKKGAVRAYISAKKGSLQYDDTPLGSLVSAIPVFGDALVEIKDTAINLLEKEENLSES